MKRLRRTKEAGRFIGKLRAFGRKTIRSDAACPEHSVAVFKRIGKLYLKGQK